MLSIGPSLCGKGQMQIRRDKRRRRRRRKGRRDGTSQGWPRPWWGSESEPEIRPASEQRDTKTPSGTNRRDISGKCQCQMAGSRQKVMGCVNEGSKGQGVRHPQNPPRLFSPYLLCLYLVKVGNVLLDSGRQMSGK